MWGCFGKVESSRVGWGGLEVSENGNFFDGWCFGMVHCAYYEIGYWVQRDKWRSKT